MSAPLTAGALSNKSGRVKEARRLNRRPERSGRRLFLAEGSKALTEALLVPDCVVEVLATVEASETYDALRKATTEAGIPWWVVTDQAMAGLADAVTPQGVVAVCRFLDVPLSSLPAEGTIVVCADVRDPGNAGTIIRTADAVGAAGVVLAGNSVDPYNAKTVRATVGSLFHLPLVLVPDPAAAVAHLRETGYTVLAADGRGEVSLTDAGDLLRDPVAWLFGNEAWGLPDDLAALADHRVAIPIHGRAESLNLSTAAAVCLYAGVLTGPES